MTDHDLSFALRLDPLDGLFFRDGRPFGAGSAASSGLPMPQTLAGALRSHLMSLMGCDFNRLQAALETGASLAEALADQEDALAAIANLTLSGPWLHRDTGASDPPGVLWPVPAILHREKSDLADGRLCLLRPLREPPPGWSTANSATTKALWAMTQGRTEPVSGFISTEGLSAILSGKVPDSSALVASADLADLFVIDHRVGLVVGAETGTAEDGLLYTAGFLRLAPGIGFAAQISGLTPPLRDALTTYPIMGWGGERRKVRVSVSCTTLLPASAEGVDGEDGQCLVLTTPAPLANGWRGAAWEPVAAVVPEAVAVSGWDLARRRPKPTRFAAPAGSVFFFDGQAPEALSGGLCEGEDRRLGYGCVAKGVWTHA